MHIYLFIFYHNIRIEVIIYLLLIDMLNSCLCAVLKCSVKEYIRSQHNTHMLIKPVLQQQH